MLDLVEHAERLCGEQIGEIEAREIEPRHGARGRRRIGSGTFQLEAALDEGFGVGPAPGGEIEEAMEIGRHAAEHPIALVGERQAMRPRDLHRVAIGQDDKIVRVRADDDALNAFEQAKIDEAARRVDAATELGNRHDDQRVAQHRIFDRKRCGGLMHAQIDRRNSGARPRIDGDWRIGRRRDALQIDNPGIAGTANAGIKAVGDDETQRRPCPSRHRIDRRKHALAMGTQAVEVEIRRSSEDDP